MHMRSKGMLNACLFWSCVPRTWSLRRSAKRPDMIRHLSTSEQQKHLHRRHSNMATEAGRQLMATLGSRLSLHTAKRALELTAVPPDNS
jgi:hypothetical protein